MIYILMSAGGPKDKAFLPWRPSKCWTQTFSCGLFPSSLHLLKEVGIFFHVLIDRGAPKVMYYPSLTSLIVFSLSRRAYTSSIEVWMTSGDFITDCEASSG